MDRRQPGFRKTITVLGPTQELVDQDTHRLWELSDQRGIETVVGDTEACVLVYEEWDIVGTEDLPIES